MLNEKRPTLLTIEDDPIIRHAIASYMGDREYTVLQAADGQQGLDIFKEEKPDIVITDLRLPLLDGMELLAAIRKESPDTPVIIVSGMGTFSDAVKAVNHGAWEYITKPISDMALLAHSAEKALKQVRLIQENRRYQLYLEEEVQKRTEELHQAQKLEAIGTLAGGIAHDFNNILSSILGYTDLAMLDTADPTALKEDLNQVKIAGNRAKDLVAQILTFSRKSPTNRQPMHISSLIKEALKLLRSTIPASVEIRSHITSGLEKVVADATEIHQLVMNLCTNAFHAMDDESGVLEVGLHHVTIEDNQACLVEGLQAGPHLKLTVQDTGCGMDSVIINNIFDPFYTTKETGKGTGLGLSVVHGIVKESGGTITVSSEPGKGSTFEIFFPVIPDTAALAKNPAPASLPRGSEHVLLVDDEPSLINTGQRMLGYLGYQVTTCSSGQAALVKFLKNPDGYDLVLTDMSMPGMRGAELAQQLLAIRPDLPIILCSGYSSRISSKMIDEIGIHRFMPKPFTLETVAFVIKDTLSEKTRPSS